MLGKTIWDDHRVTRDHHRGAIVGQCRNRNNPGIGTEERHHVPYPVGDTGSDKNILQETSIGQSVSGSSTSQLAFYSVTYTCLLYTSPSPRD